MKYDGLTFGQALQMARQEKGLQKKDVAKLFQWTPMYYGRFENDYLIPVKGNWEKFASFLGISIKELEVLVERTRKLSLF